MRSISTTSSLGVSNALANIVSKKVPNLSGVIIACVIRPNVPILMKDAPMKDAPMKDAIVSSFGSTFLHQNI